MNNLSPGDQITALFIIVVGVVVCVACICLAVAS